MVAYQSEQFSSSSSSTSSSPSSFPVYQLAPEYMLVYLLPFLSRSSVYRELSTSPSKLQIRAVDIILGELMVQNTDGIGLINAILQSVCLIQRKIGLFYQ